MDKINKLKASEARHENEIKRTKESLDGSEQRQTETEVKRRKIEGELQVITPVNVKTPYNKLYDTTKYYKISKLHISNLIFQISD